MEPVAGPSSSSTDEGSKRRRRRNIFQPVAGSEARPFSSPQRKRKRAILTTVKSFLRQYSYPMPFQHLLRNAPPAQYSKLENGLTVITEERDMYNACVGLFIDGGSRYESLFENGIAHFFEHIVYKGTNARSREVLEEQMTGTGARFDSFTTRDMVGYRVHCMANDAPICLDLLTDCVFNNNYCATEIEVQKKVVHLEMQDSDRDNNCVLDDYLHATAFQGTPLAQTVMGPSSNLLNYNPMTISRYMNKFYDANRTVLVTIGGVRHEQMLALADTYLSKLEPTKCLETEPYRYTGSEIRARDDSMPVASVAVAVEAPCLCADERVVMQIAAELLGGWDRSQGGGMDHSFPLARASALAGFCDAYRAFYTIYKDTGLWGVKFTAPSLSLDDIMHAIQGEFMSLCHTVTELEVQRARRVLKTKLLSEDADSGRSCTELGRWALYHGYRDQLSMRIAEIDKVKAIDVREVCERYLYDKCPVVAAVGPTEGLTDYTRIRANMYWLRT